MKLSGWIFMLGSLAFVWGLSIWCYYKVMTTDGSREDPSSWVEMK